MNAIGDRIKAVRQLTELPQAAFARALGVSRGAVSNWEQGKGIKTENLRLVSEIFSVSFDWLATGKTPPPTSVYLADTARAREIRAELQELTQRLNNMNSDKVKAILNLVRTFEGE